MQLSTAGLAKTIGRIILVLAVTVIGGFLALAYGTYGAIGVYHGFKEHLRWTAAEIAARMVYWILFLTGIACAAGVAAAWLLIFLHRKR